MTAIRRLAAIAAVLCLCACTPATAGADVIVDDFNGPDGLITAEG